MTELKLFIGVLLFVWMGVLIIWEIRAATIDCPAWTHALRTLLIAAMATGGFVLTGLVKP